MKLTLTVTFILTLFISSGSAFGSCYTGKTGYNCACRQCEKTYAKKTQYSCKNQCKVCNECSMQGRRCDCYNKKRHKKCRTATYVQCSLCGDSYTRGHQHHCKVRCKTCGIRYPRGTEHRCATIQCGICDTQYIKGTRHNCRHHNKQCNPYRQCDTTHTKKASSCSVQCRTCGVTYTKGIRHECRHQYRQCNPYKQCDTGHPKKVYSSCSVQCKTCGVRYTKTKGTRHECYPYL